MLVLIFQAIKSRKYIASIEATKCYTLPEDIIALSTPHIHNRILEEDVTLKYYLYKWANEGFIKISINDEHDIILTKQDDIYSEDDFETELFDKLFSIDEEITNISMKSLKYKLTMISSNLISKVGESIKSKLGRKSIDFSLPIIIFIIIGCVNTYNSISDKGFTSIETLMVTIFAGLILFSIFLVSTNMRYDRDLSIAENIIDSRFFYPLLFLIGFYILGQWFFIDLCRFNSFNFIINLISIIAVIPSYFIVEEKNEYELYAYSCISGFKRFLQNPDEDELKEILDIDSNYFYKMLPYAALLDVSDYWIDSFINKDIVRHDNYPAFNNYEDARSIDSLIHYYLIKSLKVRNNSREAKLCRKIYTVLTDKEI